MNKTKKIVAFAILIGVIGIVVLSAPSILSLLQQSGYTKLTLAKGALVISTQGDSEYTFRYGGAFSIELTLLQVWVSGNAFPKEFRPINEGATYTAFAIEIKISEMHEDYIVILVKPL